MKYLAPEKQRKKALKTGILREKQKSTAISKKHILKKNSTVLEYRYKQNGKIPKILEKRWQKLLCAI